MTLKTILGWMATLAGLGSAFLGLLFLIASRGEGSRLVAGLIMLAVGITVFFMGLSLVRKGMRFSPRGIRKGLLRLAKLNHGEISMDLIAANLGDTDDVRQQIYQLMRENLALEKKQNGRALYLFKEFQLEIIQKKCPYCGNDYPVRDDIESCPNCGGDLKLGKNNITDADSYSMDEGD